MTLGQVIKDYRESHGLTMQAFADKAGLSKGYISMLESGKNPRSGKPIKPGLDALNQISKAMGISLNGLLDGVDDNQVISLEKDLVQPTVTDDIVEFPVIGEVAAGYEHIAAEDWTGETVSIPTAYLHGRPRSDYFVLTVCGNSMYPLYMDGDKVLVLKQSTLDRSGQIGVIRYDGDKASLKKVEYAAGEDWLRMVPVNPSYMPQEIKGADLEKCSIIGIPQLLLREIEK